MATVGLDLISNLSVVTAATGLAVTRARAKSWCRVDHNQDDADIDNLIKAATDYVQKGTYGNRQLLPATLSIKACDWWDDELNLPLPPLSSVSSLTYLDRNGASQTVATGDYTVRTYLNQPGTIELTWLSTDTVPVLYADTSWPITIQFVAGYADAASIPANVQMAILLLVSHWYTNREAAGDAPEAVDRLLKLEGWGSYC